MLDLIKYLEDIAVFERAGPTEESVLISLQSCDLVEHVDTTWRVVGKCAGVASMLFRSNTGSLREWDPNY